MTQVDIKLVVKTLANDSLKYLKAFTYIECPNYSYALQFCHDCHDLVEVWAETRESEKASLKKRRKLFTFLYFIQV